jgi:signal transduction histidine kinase
MEENLILVVDDTPENLADISGSLMDAGFEVATATDGESALKQIRSNQPDLILLDVKMPGTDGFEICRQLKANPITTDIPVIFLTACAETHHKVLGFNLGAVDYITKPFQEAEVLARVKTHIKQFTKTKNLKKKLSKRTVELSEVLQNLQESELRLQESEKMSALGQLLAIVAHDINNPVGFIDGNLSHAREFIQDLVRLIDLYQLYYPNPVAEIQAEITAIDLEYVREELPKLIASMQEGVNRILHLSSSLRTFSRADPESKIPFNIHEGIDSTLLILKHRLKSNQKRPAIEIVKNYGKLPLVICFPGQLNQVFMNLLANAIDAVEETNIGRNYKTIQKSPNQIVITTALVESLESVLISIKDNGVGISDEAKPKIFDRLYTTKMIEKGTGLGLYIAHQIIVEKHGGSINLTSSPGEGAEFIIVLPVEGQSAVSSQQSANS